MISESMEDTARDWAAISTPGDVQEARTFLVPWEYHVTVE